MFLNQTNLNPALDNICKFVILVFMKEVQIPFSKNPPSPTKSLLKSFHAFKRLKTDTAPAQKANVIELERRDKGLDLKIVSLKEQCDIAIKQRDVLR